MLNSNISNESAQGFGEWLRESNYAFIYKTTVNGVGRAAFDEEVKHLIEDMPGKKLREYLDTEDNPRINISKIKSLLNTVNGLEAKGIIIPK